MTYSNISYENGDFTLVFIMIIAVHDINKMQMILIDNCRIRATFDHCRYADNTLKYLCMQMIIEWYRDRSDW